MTEEEIRERDAQYMTGAPLEPRLRTLNEDRRWLLRELDNCRDEIENLRECGQLMGEQLAEAHRELERVRKDLAICRKSKSAYDYSDKMSERLNAEVNHLLKEKVKRLEQQLAEARKDTERLDFSERWIEGWRSKPENYLKCISIAVDKDLMPTIRQAIDNARGKE